MSEQKKYQSFQVKDRPDPRCQLYFIRKLRGTHAFYIVMIIIQIGLPYYLNKDNLNEKTGELLISKMITENNAKILARIEKIVSEAVTTKK